MRWTLLLLVPFWGLAQNDTVRDDKASDYNLNKPERVEWFRNTGAGLFIHLGVDAPLGIVISHSLVGASDDYVERYYRELPSVFDPSAFNPREICVLARLAGMKYIVFTAKHHSGFCMWDTRTTDLNIMHTPYGRDLLGEYVSAARAEGLGVGLYFSPEDFYFLHTHHIPISRTDVHMDSATRQAYDEYTRRQCTELMTHYGRIDVLFIDGEPKEVVKETCWKLQPDLLITRGALRTPEQVLPGDKSTDPWLSCLTMGTAWQYQPTNERYKTGTQLIQLLIEARAKGGSLLLNTGPRPDGTLAPEQEGLLREMAAWYFINRACMDSVRPWIVAREGDTWFTRRGDTVYAIVTGPWQEGVRKTLLLHSVVATSATVVDVLGQNSRVIEYKNDDVSCRFRQTASGFEVSAVKAQRIYDDHRWPNPVVLRLCGVRPAFTQEITVRTGSSFTGQAWGGGDSACFYYRPYAGQVETLYNGPWRRTRWVRVAADGRFSVRPPQGTFEYRAVVGFHGVEIDGDVQVYRPSASTAFPPGSAAASRAPLRAPAAVPALIPFPVQWLPAGGAPFVFGHGVTVTVEDPSLEAAAGWIRAAARAGAAQPSSGTIHLSIDTTVAPDAEGYRLVVDAHHVELTGHDVAGVIYGVQTLKQLSVAAGLVPACTILDHPRFAWRGMHLDVGRHFFPPAYIKRFIDLLVLYKFNTFHWHLTEDQGWRIEIRRYPRLQQVAAWRSETLIGHKRDTPHRFDGRRYGGFYTQAEIRDIVRYAAERHITIVPEIEMPGHASAALAAYPGLGCTGGPYSTATYWGIFDDVFCAGKDSTFTWLDNVLDEVMDLFPSSYIHIGGDECPKTRWKACPLCQARIRALGLGDEEGLQSYFIQRIARYVESKGRHVIGWDEILEGGLAPDATVMSWRGEEGGLAAAKAGHKVVMTPESHLYFDYYQSHYAGEPLAGGGYTPLEAVYGYEPALKGPALLGLQGCLWTEYIATPAKLEYMMFPRAAALAERAWSPEGGSYADFLARWKAQAPLLKGVRYRRTGDVVFASSVDSGGIRLTLTSDEPVRYSIKGQAAAYTAPIHLKHTATVTAWLGDRSYRQTFYVHEALGARVQLTHPPIARFDPGAQALVNGVTGDRRYNDGQWLGWSGEDLEAVVDLGRSRSVGRLGIDFLHYPWQKMWAPRKVTFLLSEDGVHYTEQYHQEHFPVNGINRVRCAFPPRFARFVKVIALNKGVIPEGAYGAGGQALLLADEIFVDP